MEFLILYDKFMIYKIGVLRKQVNTMHARKFLIMVFKRPMTRVPLSVFVLFDLFNHLYNYT